MKKVFMLLALLGCTLSGFADMEFILVTLHIMGF